MTEPGLRERKKRRMYERVSEVAIGLFLEKGFDAVSVAEVAAAAEISKPTLFRYFPAKEDLVLYRIADHEDEAARVVAGVAEPVAALREHFLRGLEVGDPVTGLSDHRQVLAFHRLLYGTPALLARVYTYQQRAEDALAEVLGGGVDGRVAAAQIVAVQRVLAMENWRRVAGGEGVADVREDAVAAAERAFGALERAFPGLRLGK
ncbi:TetR family transcriptional regulator [Streptomyces sp. NPDC047072]|uniref:TetR/AcrR family transcriptional regulator n=1 Tax=Streptomyces sp. NPDC047072 TaxID=3154809 RepID=UPI0033D9461F